MFDLTAATSAVAGVTTFLTETGAASYVALGLVGAVVATIVRQVRKGVRG